MRTKFKTIVIISDVHMDSTTTNRMYEIAHRFIKKLEPNELILAGDILDCGCISRHNNGNIRAVEGRRLFEDFKTLNQYVTDVRPMVEKITYIEGNHENWIEQAIDKDPSALHGLIELDNNIEKVDNFIMNYNDHTKNYTQRGHLHILHGGYTGVGACRKYIREYGVNVAFGHTHLIQSDSHINLKGEAIGAWNIGCLCENNPSYLRGRRPQWRIGFAIVNLFYNGDFQFNQINIINNRFIYNGEVYK